MWHVVTNWRISIDTALLATSKVAEPEGRELSTVPVIP